MTPRRAQPASRPATHPPTNPRSTAQSRQPGTPTALQIRSPTITAAALQIRRLPSASILQIRRPHSTCYDIRHDHVSRRTSTAGTKSRNDLRVMHHCRLRSRRTVRSGCALWEKISAANKTAALAISRGLCLSSKNLTMIVFGWYRFRRNKNLSTSILITAIQAAPPLPRCSHSYVS
jgi:hypothetical protein